MKLKYLIQIFLVFVLAGCAQQYPITGGEKDTESPKIESSNPQNYSTNFVGRRIELTFDEYVQLKSINQEFISSPPLEKQPEFTLKKKTVTMDLMESLEENTTYNFNFGAGIVDFTEGNPLDSNLFVLSTGPFLDSLFIHGKVEDAFNKTPIENALIGLYKNLTDTATTTEKPSFITKTNKRGIFNLDYLPKSEFQIIAFDDINGNYIFDQGIERVAFVNKLANTTQPDTFSFRFFKEAPSKQQMKKANASHFGLAGLKFSLPVNTLDIRVQEDSIGTSVFPVFNSTKDSLELFFFPPIERDTLALQVLADSVWDTLIYRLPSYEKALKAMEKGRTDVSLDIALKLAGSNHHFFDTLFIESNNPLKAFNPDQIYFVHNNDTLPQDSFNLETFNKPAFGKESTILGQQIALHYQWKPNQSFKLILLPNAFTDVYGLSNDTLIYPFKTQKFEEYGQLEVAVKNLPNGPFILELLNGQGEVVERSFQTTDHLLEFPYLPPAKYGLRIIVDRDNNKKWTTGNFTAKTQPEPIFYFPETIEVRANWELDYEWDFREVR